MNEFRRNVYLNSVITITYTCHQIRHIHQKRNTDTKAISHKKKAKKRRKTKEEKHIYCF